MTANTPVKTAMPFFTLPYTLCVALNQIRLQLTMMRPHASVNSGMLFAPIAMDEPIVVKVIQKRESACGHAHAHAWFSLSLRIY